MIKETAKFTGMMLLAFWIMLLGIAAEQTIIEKAGAGEWNRFLPLFNVMMATGVSLFVTWKGVWDFSVFLSKHRKTGNKQEVSAISHSA